MAQEAFALSPISARAAQPSEADYAAISEAFMETSRGRWFLSEYAKRNRNADTRMVLDAVARIEETLVAQRQGDTGPALAEALAAIRRAVEAAEVSATVALDGLALEPKLAPVHKGARVIREIAWRLREIGADGRICDLIDSQVGAIETGAAQITADEAKAALSAAFASIEARLAEFGDYDSATAKTGVSVPSPDDIAETVQSLGTEEPSGTKSEVMASAEDAIDEIEPANIIDEAADSYDEAMLDLIAQEMGASDPFGEDAAVADCKACAAEPPAVARTTIAEAPETIFAPELPPAEPLRQPAIDAPSPPEPAMSLGSSLIASGLLKNSSSPVNDPLAPIRRMSQVEKIAFFS